MMARLGGGRADDTGFKVLGSANVKVERIEAGASAADRGSFAKGCDGTYATGHGGRRICGRTAIYRVTDSTGTHEYCERHRAAAVRADQKAQR